jgi:hypothetical protein
MMDCRTCKHGYYAFPGTPQMVFICTHVDCRKTTENGRTTVYTLWERKQSLRKTKFEQWRDSLTIEDFLHADKTQMNFRECIQCPAYGRCQAKFAELSGVDCAVRFCKWADEYVEDGEPL